MRTQFTSIFVISAFSFSSLAMADGHPLGGFLDDVDASELATDIDENEALDDSGDSSDILERETDLTRERSSFSEASMRAGTPPRTGKTTAATNYKFLDFRMYDLQAISSTGYTAQRNVFDYGSPTNSGTSSEVVSGTFYAWLPNAAVAVKEFVLSKPVAAGSYCTSWLYQFRTAGTSSYSSCNLKVCFSGATLDFTSCTTGYVARGLIY